MDKLSELFDTIFTTIEFSYKVDHLRKAAPSPMVSTDFWAVMIPHLYMAEDKEAADFYKRVYEEVKYNVDNKIGVIPNEKYRMLFSELPPWHTLGFFDELAERHGIAFVFESWIYHAPPPLPEKERYGVNDPLELMARYSYHKFHHAAPIAREHDVDPIIFTAPYLEYVKEYRADGLMGHPLFSCRPATYTLQHVRNLLMEKFMVPSVSVEGDIVDLRVFNWEEAHTKMDAFIETMDYNRERRKKAGLAW
jgi:benzoyl-CoA reductase/2-hydroxyglutaryl-CoA dehydratase subunit BcrC/BadD/HgdB